MAITTKPKAKEVQKEDEIDVLINQGGSVATKPSDGQSGNKDQNVMLRIPVALLEKLDAELNKGIVKKKRHPWILEAIVEKLQRSGALEL